MVGAIDQVANPMGPAIDAYKAAPGTSKSGNSGPQAIGAAHNPQLAFVINIEKAKNYIGGQIDQAFNADAIKLEQAFLQLLKNPHVLSRETITLLREKGFEANDLANLMKSGQYRQDIRMACAATVMAGALATTFLFGASYATGLNLTPQASVQTALGLMTAYLVLFHGYGSRNTQTDPAQQNHSAAGTGANGIAAAAENALVNAYYAVANVPKGDYALTLARNTASELKATTSFEQIQNYSTVLAHGFEAGALAWEGLAAIQAKMSNFDSRQVSMAAMGRALVVMMQIITAKVMAGVASISDAEQARELNISSNHLNAMIRTGGTYKASSEVTNADMAMRAELCVEQHRLDVDRESDFLKIQSRIKGDGIAMSAQELCAIVKPFFKKQEESTQEKLQQLGITCSTLANTLSSAQWIDLSHAMAGLPNNPDNREIQSAMLSEMSRKLEGNLDETAHMAMLSPWILRLGELDYAVQYPVIDMACSAVKNANMSDAFVDDLTQRVGELVAKNQNSYFLGSVFPRDILAAVQQRTETIKKLNDNASAV